MITRFIIEGEWSGYTRAQQHVVHRIVYPASRKQLRAWAAATYGIRLTDGTMLLHHGVTSVDALAEAMAAAKAKARAAWDINESAS